MLLIYKSTLAVVYVTALSVYLTRPASIYSIIYEVVGESFTSVALLKTCVPRFVEWLNTVESNCGGKRNNKRAAADAGKKAPIGKSG